MSPKRQVQASRIDKQKILDNSDCLAALSLTDGRDLSQQSPNISRSRHISTKQSELAERGQGQEQEQLGAGPTFQIQRHPRLLGRFSLRLPLMLHPWASLAYLRSGRDESVFRQSARIE